MEKQKDWVAQSLNLFKKYSSSRSVLLRVINDPHVDFEKEHYTGLLYLNDSDGDTFIYNQKYDPSTNLLMQEYFNTFLNGHLSVKETISPKQNRLVIFDGHYFHSSSTPTIVPARYVVNFNFTIR